MNAEKFWLGWLKITMIIVIIGGAFLAVIPQFFNIPFLDAQLHNGFFFGGIPEGVPAFTRWITGVTGAVMLSWGFSMLYVVNHPFRQHEKWAWRSVFYPVLTWYIIDSVVSAHFGVGFNVVVNSILFLQIMAPLLFLRNYFFEQVRVVS